MKFTYKQKLRFCELKKNGMSYKNIARLFNMQKSEVEYIWHLYERHGKDVLKHNYTHWTKSQKEYAVRRVINGESINSVSLDMAISNEGTLARWVKEYKENGYTIVERSRGRPPMNKSSTNKKENLAKEEYLKQLEKENLELRIENEYLKKLDALVQQRKAQQLKKKSS